MMPLLCSPYNVQEIKHLEGGKHKICCYHHNFPCTWLYAYTYMCKGTISYGIAASKQINEGRVTTHSYIVTNCYGCLHKCKYNVVNTVSYRIYSSNRLGHHVHVLWNTYAYTESWLHCEVKAVANNYTCYNHTVVVILLFT